MKQGWINLKIQNIKVDIDKLCDDILGWGAASVTVQGDEGTESLESSWFNEPGEPRYGNWRNKFIIALFPGNDEKEIALNLINAEYPENSFSISEKILVDKDWVRHTQVIHDPIEVVPGTSIVSPWHKMENEGTRYIIIDPGLGFGTGTHPTTFMCLKWICKNIGSRTSFLDYGCGSGILGVTAAVFGAAPVHGVDIDDQALSATEQNSVLNKVDIRCGKPQSVIGQTFDNIVANILADPLVKLSEILINLLNPGGTLIMAGIFETQAEKIIKAYYPGIKLNQINRREGWVLLQGIKS